MLDPLFDGITAVLAFFYELVPDYGIAIILLTVSLNLILTPLTLKGTKSMIQMQRLQPEMKRLQAKYKDDRPKLNEEMMNFYRENQINPLGGCLPLLVQMPVWIILFQILRGLTHRAEDGTFDPKYLDHDSSLYEALHGAREMNWLGFDLAKSAADVLSDDFISGFPYLVLILIVLVSGYAQQKQIQGRNTGREISQQQQMITRIMPIFLAFISYTLQAGLVVYFAASNLFRVVQQWFITRTLYADDGPVEAKSRQVPKSDRDDSKLPGGNGQKGNGQKAAKPKASTPPKGRATPARDGKPRQGGRSGNKGKGQNRRTSASKALPQPRPRKKRRK